MQEFFIGGGERGVRLKSRPSSLPPQPHRKIKFSPQPLAKPPIFLYNELINPTEVPP